MGGFAAAAGPGPSLLAGSEFRQAHQGRRVGAIPPELAEALVAAVVLAPAVGLDGGHAEGHAFADVEAGQQIQPGQQLRGGALLGAGCAWEAVQRAGAFSICRLASAKACPMSAKVFAHPR